MNHRGRILVLALLALGGCGGGEEERAPASGASPQETLRAAQEAIRGVDSYHIAGSQTGGDADIRLEADVAAGSALRLTLEQDSSSAEMIILDGDTSYIRANRAFWDDTDATARVGDLLTDRWAVVPIDEDTKRIYDEVQPDVVAGCLDDRLGTLSVRRGTLDGEPVEILIDAGDKPGTAPGELYISADEPRLPLRLRQTGARKPGGPAPDPRCSDDEEDPGDRSDLRLSRFGESFAIEPPAGALDLEDLAREAEGQSTA
jgi:PAS domain-containing protein